MCKYKPTDGGKHNWYLLIRLGKKDYWTVPTSTGDIPGAWTTPEAAVRVTAFTFSHAKNRNSVFLFSFSHRSSKEKQAVLQ